MGSKLAIFSLPILGKKHKIWALTLKRLGSEFLVVGWGGESAPPLNPTSNLQGLFLFMKGVYHWIFRMIHWFLGHLWRKYQEIQVLSMPLLAGEGRFGPPLTPPQIYRDCFLLWRESTVEVLEHFIDSLEYLRGEKSKFLVVGQGEGRFKFSKIRKSYLKFLFLIFLKNGLQIWIQHIKID